MKHLLTISLCFLALSLSAQTESCENVNSCGCQNSNAYNYNSNALEQGVCQYFIPSNRKRFNLEYFIDEYGKIKQLDTGDVLDVSPQIEHFVELGSTGFSALTINGDLYLGDVLLGSNIVAFDQINDFIIGVDNDGYIITYGESELQSYLPNQYFGPSIISLDLAYSFSTDNPTHLSLLNSEGYVIYYGPGDLEDLMSNQGKIIDIVCGPDVTYYTTIDGQLGEFAHNNLASYLGWGPNPTDVPLNHRGKVAGFAGAGYLNLTYFLDDNTAHTIGEESLFSIPVSNENARVCATIGKPFNSQVVWMDLEGNIRDQNHDIINHGSLWTNWDKTSLVCPTCQTFCEQEEACNYGQPEPCRFFPKMIPRRVDAGWSNMVALDIDGSMFYWGQSILDTLHGPFDSIPPLKQVMVTYNNYSGSDFDQIVFGLDTNNSLHVYDFTPPTTLYNENAQSASYKAIPIEIIDTPIIKMDRHMGVISALTVNGTLALWGSKYMVSDPQNTAFSELYFEVEDYFVHHWFAIIKYLDGTIEYVKIREEPVFTAHRISYAGISSNIINWPSPLQYCPLIYKNGQVALIGRVSKNDLLKDIHSNKIELFDIVPRLLTNPSTWYAIGAHGELITQESNPLESVSSQVDGIVELTGMGAFSYGVTENGTVEPVGITATAAAEQFSTEPFITGRNCYCGEETLSLECPCTDIDGDEICDQFDICNNTDNQDCGYCGIGTQWDNDSQSCVISCEGDFNSDQDVNIVDLLDLMSLYGSECVVPDVYVNDFPSLCGNGTTWMGINLGCTIVCSEDIDASGWIGLGDLLLLLLNYGQTCE